MATKNKYEQLTLKFVSECAMTLQQEFSELEQKIRESLKHDPEQYHYKPARIPGNRDELMKAVSALSIELGRTPSRFPKKFADLRQTYISYTVALNKCNILYRGIIKDWYDKHNVLPAGFSDIRMVDLVGYRQLKTGCEYLKKNLPTAPNPTMPSPAMPSSDFKNHLEAIGNWQNPYC